ncbi:hypothetical protein [Vibrio gallicus]|uniref:hypothetical protein n=1 Tax=Vibrio gallicus TaxID=190897 RepID=UPI0021C2A88E|nr:hypothetical protein [Vibrio gallicus]
MKINLQSYEALAHYTDLDKRPIRIKSYIETIIIDALLNKPTKILGKQASPKINGKSEDIILTNTVINIIKQRIKDEGLSLTVNDAVDKLLHNAVSHQYSDKYLKKMLGMAHKYQQVLDGNK